MGDRKFSLVEFGKIYLSEYVDLSLEMLFIALFLPVALFDLLGWVFGFVMLIGAITTVIFGLQKLGVQTETAQGADPNAFLISLTILVGSTALGVGYWFLHQWTKNLEESLYAHLRDKFENIKALFTY
jgi:predicted membrane chloride channel (bestrophin family)